MDLELEVPEGEALSLVSTPTENKEHMKEEESIVPPNRNKLWTPRRLGPREGRNGREVDGWSS